MFSTRAVTLLLLTYGIIPGLAPPFAQDSATGSIHGTVFDPAGGRIAKASIVVVNEATTARHTAATDAGGIFLLDLLSPGDYSARVEAPGMSPEVTPPLHLDVGGTTELEFRLKLAGARESLTVSAAPMLVETKPSAVSTLLDERAVNDFPMNGRRFSDLGLFSPGGDTGSTRSHIGHQWGPLFRRQPRLSEHFLGGWRRLQQCLFRSGPRTLPHSLQLLQRSCPGVPRLIQCIWCGARPLWRGSDQCGHKIRI